jgi:hypothetical protein
MAPAVYRKEVVGVSGAYNTDGGGDAMIPTSSPAEQEILKELSRVLRKLDDIEARLKTIEQDVQRVKREVHS